MANIEDFCAAADSAGLKVLFVVLDSCFGDVNAEASWIADSRYRNMSWMPNPGPAIVDKGPAGWTKLDEYVSELVTAHKSDKRVLGWDVMNEPAFNDKMITPFIQHFTNIINAIDETHFTCVGGAANSPHTDGLSNLTVLTYHDYSGAADGTKLGADVAAAQKLGKTLGKPTMVTESFGRGSRSDDPAKRKYNDPKGDSLHSVLRGMNGCIAGAAKTGFFIWELMFGVDQFNGGQPSVSHPGVLPFWGPPGAPYQGLILPAAAGDRGGQWRFAEEEALWKSHGVTRTCPPATL